MNRRNEEGMMIWGEWHAKQHEPCQWSVRPSCPQAQCSSPQSDRGVYNGHRVFSARRLDFGQRRQIERGGKKKGWDSRCQDPDDDK